MATFTLAGLLAATGSVSSQPIGWLVSSSHLSTQIGGVAAPDACASHAFAVTPSDSTVFSPPCRWLWVGGTGNLALTMLDGSTFLFSSVASGTRVPFAVTQVLRTNTTATAIVGVT